VTVSLDGDVLTLNAQVAGMPEILSDGSVLFLLNTDSNAGSGKYLAADYVLMLDMKTLQGMTLQWNGSDYVAAAKVADPTRMLIGSGGAGFTFNLANFASPKHIEFAMIVVKGQPDGGLLDAAPDSGLWVFDTVAPAPAPAPTPTPAPAPKPAIVKPLIGAAVAMPRAAVAGKRMTVTFLVKRSDNGQPLTSGTMICDPSIAGKMLPHSESFRAGKARMSFLVPKTAKGKLLRVKVTIKAGTQSATRIAALRVT
jgi:hypothetical protein